MNILILTGKFGMGHWSASQSLRLQLLNAFPAANVTVEDFFAYALPDASEAIYKGFSLLVTHGSGSITSTTKPRRTPRSRLGPRWKASSRTSLPSCCGSGGLTP